MAFLHLTFVNFEFRDLGHSDFFSFVFSPHQVLAPTRYNHCSSGRTFFLNTQEMVVNLLKIKYFHQKKLLCNYYAKLLLFMLCKLFMHKYICKILNHSMRYFFFLNSQKSPFFRRSN